MRKKEKVEYILSTMDEMFKDYPLTELEYENPLQLLVAVMLSAQTTDKQVNKVSSHFFKELFTPDDIIRLGEAGVKEYIKTVGLHVSKTKNLVKTGFLLQEMTAEYLQKSGVKRTHFSGRKNFREEQYFYKDGSEIYEEWGYRLPDTIEGMTRLAGVGIKTAKVVLYVLYGQKRVAVDTHVHRVMNRLGIIKTNSPDQSSKKLEKIIPDNLKDVAHRVIIYFGRYLCIARKPQCERCPFADRCPGKKKIDKEILKKLKKKQRTRD